MLTAITLTPIFSPNNMISLELTVEQYNAIVYALTTLDKKRETSRKYQQEKAKKAGPTPKSKTTKIALHLPDVVSPQDVISPQETQS